MKLVGYNNFGLKEEWLDFFMMNPNTFFKDEEHGLNVKEQLPSFVKWLVHAEIIDDVKDKNLTELGKLLVNIYQDNPSLVWEIIWVNLTYSSPIAEWYSKTIPYLTKMESASLKDMVKIDYPDNSDTTIKNIVYALTRTFNESPIGCELNQYCTEGKKFIRRPADDLSIEAFAYSLYRYAEYRGTNEFRVSSIMTDNKKGPKKEFGVERSTMIKMLKTLHLNGILLAELNMGLDNITLKLNKSAADILKEMTE